MDIKPIEDGAPTPAEMFQQQLMLLSEPAPDDGPQLADVADQLHVEEDNLFSVEFANGAIASVSVVWTAW